MPTGRNDSGEENVPLDLSRGGFSPVSNMLKRFHIRNVWAVFGNRRGLQLRGVLFVDACDGGHWSITQTGWYFRG